MQNWPRNKKKSDCRQKGLLLSWTSGANKSKNMYLMGAFKIAHIDSHHSTAHFKVMTVSVLLAYLHKWASIDWRICSKTTAMAFRGSLRRLVCAPSCRSRSCVMISSWQNWVIRGIHIKMINCKCSNVLCSCVFNHFLCFCFQTKHKDWNARLQF